MTEHHILWLLFVGFAVLSIIVLQRGFRTWRRQEEALRRLRAPPPELERRHRADRLRLLCFSGSVVAMTALVFAVLLRAPPALVLGLQMLAVGTVAAGIIAALRR